MPRTAKKRSETQIIFDRGETFVQSEAITAYYRYRRWVLKVNPKLLFPGFRKDHRKRIYVNGRKYGFAEFRQACIPLPQYLEDAPGIGFKFINWIRVHWGLCCRSTDRGYFYIKLGKQEYVVLRRYTKDRNIFCQIYYKPTGEMLGSFIFDKDFNNVYPHWSVDNWVRSMYVIIGYVADAVIYSTVAQQLNRRLNVVIG